MRHILFFMVVAISQILLFGSCGKESDDKNEIIEDVLEEDKELPIIGTWANGNYFVSFSNEGYYSAYIADTFIDSGTYERIDDEINCFNNYFQRHTEYTIKDLSDSEMTLIIKYIDVWGNENKNEMTLIKTDGDIISKNNTLTGKSISWLSNYFGTITMTFSSSNSGIKAASKGSAAKYPLNFFYIYVGDKLYYQLLSNNSIQVPSIGGWTTDYNNVKCWKLYFSPNGSIDKFDVIDL